MLTCIESVQSFVSIRHFCRTLVLRLRYRTLGSRASKRHLQLVRSLCSVLGTIFIWKTAKVCKGITWGVSTRNAHKVQPPQKKIWVTPSHEFTVKSLLLVLRLVTCNYIEWAGDCAVFIVNCWSKICSCKWKSGFFQKNCNAWRKIWR